MIALAQMFTNEGGIEDHAFNQGGGSDSTPVAGAPPRTGVPPGESIGVRALVPARSDRDHSEEPGVGDQRDRPVCLRAEGEEADQDNDNRPAWVPKGRTRNGRCKAGKCTGWLTPSGQTEHPGQTCQNRDSKEKDLDTGDKRGGRNEEARKAVKNALEEELVLPIIGPMERLKPTLPPTSEAVREIPVPWHEEFSVF